MLQEMIIECSGLFPRALLEAASHVVGRPIFIAIHLLFGFKQS